MHGIQHSQLSTFPFHLCCLMTSFSIWITIFSKQHQPFSLSVSKGLCWLFYSASLLQADAVLTWYHKALVACNSSINKLVGAPAFPIVSGTEIRSLSVNRDQTPTGKWALPLTPKLYWPSSTWTNMNLRVTTSSPASLTNVKVFLPLQVMFVRSHERYRTADGKQEAEKLEQSQGLSQSRLWAQLWDFTHCLAGAQGETRTHFTIFFYIWPSL